MQAAVVIQPARGAGQDRAVAIPTPSGYLLAVADGAGGTGSGADAAELVIVLINKRLANASSTDWFDALCVFDDELSSRGSGGQTTAVVAFVDGRRVVGASVGDPAAWIISPAGELTDLTARQRRRPLLGSGEALPVQFEAELNGGRLLLATDGLVKYATVEQICALATQGSVARAADALANCVRLPSGTLQDDVAVVVLTGETN